MLGQIERGSMQIYFWFINFSFLLMFLNVIYLISEDQMKFITKNEMVHNAALIPDRASI